MIFVAVTIRLTVRWLEASSASNLERPWGRHRWPEGARRLRRTPRQPSRRCHATAPLPHRRGRQCASAIPSPWKSRGHPSRHSPFLERSAPLAELGEHNWRDASWPCRRLAGKSGDTPAWTLYTMSRPHAGHSIEGSETDEILLAASSDTHST